MMCFIKFCRNARQIYDESVLSVMIKRFVMHIAAWFNIVIVKTSILVLLNAFCFNIRNRRLSVTGLLVKYLHINYIILNVNIVKYFTH